jgi:hypothetical protein
LEFSFNTHELANWKARITERLVQLYIKEVLAPRLHEDGFDLVFSTAQNSGDDHLDHGVRLVFPLSDAVKALLRGDRKIDWFRLCTECVISINDRKFEDFPKEEQKSFVDRWKKDEEDEAEAFLRNLRLFFVGKGVCASSHLLGKAIGLSCLLDVATDGILFKLRKTGEFISSEDAYPLGSSPLGDESEQLPIVDGDIEVIEVKCGKATLPSNQVENYANVIRKGYPLRYFKVDIISFEKNQFEIRDKLVRNPDEIKSRIDLE